MGSQSFAATIAEASIGNERATVGKYDLSGMTEEAQKPQCATGVGLILYGLVHKHEIEEGFAKSETKIFEAIKKRFRRWFGSVTTV